MSWLRPSEQKRGNRMNQDNLDCISVANMRESDRLTIERFCPGRRLMYRAALGVFRAAAWDGVTIADFDQNNKIYRLCEFQSKAEHIFPYGE